MPETDEPTIITFSKLRRAAWRCRTSSTSRRAPSRRCSCPTTSTATAQDIGARARLQGPVPDHRRQREVLARVRPLLARRAKYAVEECIERDMTYSAPLKATLRSSSTRRSTGQKRLKNIIEKEVYLGELPLLTPLGTFVINGAERVIVSQLHRSPGVVFEEATHPNGQRLISRADHPVPRLVGRVHGRHPRRDLRPHRQEEEVPGHGAAARLRLRDQRGHPEALLRDEGPRPSPASARAGRRSARSSARCVAEDVPNPEDAAGRAAGRRWATSSPRSGSTSCGTRGVKSVTVFAGYTTHRPARGGAADHHPRPARTTCSPSTSADPETGEVIAEAGDELTDALRKKLIKAGSQQGRGVRAPRPAPSRR